MIELTPQERIVAQLIIVTFSLLVIAGTLAFIRSKGWSNVPVSAYIVSGLLVTIALYLHPAGQLEAIWLSMKAGLDTLFELQLFWYGLCTGLIVLAAAILVITAIVTESEDFT